VSKVPDDGPPTAGLGTRTARSKFLEAVKRAAEASHLELIIEPDGPGSGLGYIQRRDSFSNFYSFHFEFGDTYAVFYLGTDSVKDATSEQRRQVEYKDGKGMELVLEEIREKIGEGAENAYPFLSSLSSPKTEPPASQGTPASAPRASPSARNDAAVWGQSAKTLEDTRYRHMKMPRRSHTTVIVAVVLLLALVFTLAPVLNESGEITSCHGGSCHTSSAYYLSPSFSAFGVGGVYVPKGVGWGTFGAGTVQTSNGTLMSGIGLREFYLVW